MGTKTMATSKKETKLSVWLAKSERTISWLQRETGIAYPNLHAIVHGGRCRKATAELIFEAVAREIPVEDIMDAR